MLQPLLACTPAESREPVATRTVQVVATTGMIADLATEVGGDRVEVAALMGPGVDPHLYKASEGDVRKLFRADVILYNGLHLESKMGEVLEHMSGEVTTVPVAEGIARERLLTPPEFEGAYDPHVWHDVTLWMEAVERVAAAFAEADPAHAARYQENADRYLARLRALDAYVRTQIGRLPPERRVLITAHDAFNYFGKEYGVEVRGLQGISTVSEAGTADVQALADFIAERGIPAVFVESSVSPRAIEAVRAAVRSRGSEVSIGGSLYADAPGDEGTPEGTYVGMIRHNVDTLVGALLGER